MSGFVFGEVDVPRGVPLRGPLAESLPRGVSHGETISKNIVHSTGDFLNEPVLNIAAPLVVQSFTFATNRSANALDMRPKNPDGTDGSRLQLPMVIATNGAPQNNIQPSRLSEMGDAPEIHGLKLTYFSGTPGAGSADAVLTLVRPMVFPTGVRIQAIASNESTIQVVAHVLYMDEGL